MSPKRVTLKQLFSSYKEEVNNPLDYKLYFKILQTVGEVLVDELNTGSKINLPSRIGTLQLVKYIPKNPRIDFISSKKYNRLIRFTNMHSNGFGIKLHWSKKYAANFKNKKFWAFDLTRSNQRYNKNSIVQHAKKYGVKQLYEV